MTTKEFQERSLLRIFLSYFKPHRRLFALDMTCAFLIALVDLAFPLVSRTAMYTWLPEKQLDVFFVTLNKADKDYSPTTMYKDYRQ